MSCSQHTVGDSRLSTPTCIACWALYPSEDCYWCFYKLVLLFCCFHSVPLSCVFSPRLDSTGGNSGVASVISDSSRNGPCMAGLWSRCSLAALAAAANAAPRSLVPSNVSRGCVEGTWGLGVEVYGGVVAKGVRPRPKLLLLLLLLCRQRSTDYTISLSASHCNCGLHLPVSLSWSSCQPLAQINSTAGPGNRSVCLLQSLNGMIQCTGGSGEYGYSLLKFAAAGRYLALTFPAVHVEQQPLRSTPWCSCSR